MSKETHKDRILNYMKTYGCITTWNAFKDLGCTRLSAYIFNLKKDGYKIKTETMKVRTRFGNETSINKYSLIDNKVYDDMTYIK